MRQHGLVLLVFMLLFVLGCTGRAYTPNYMADKTISREQAMVVLGAEVGGNIQSYLVALYLNGELVGMQGPIEGKSKNSGRHIIISNTYKLIAADTLS